MSVLTVGFFAGYAHFKQLYSADIFGFVCGQLALAFGITVGSSYVVENSRRQKYILELALKEAQARADGLLRNVFPETIADRFLAEGDDVQIVQRFDRVAVLFADIVGFTALSAKESPEAIVALLDALFSRFDALVTVHGVEKIKTIGDAYMAVAGAPTVVEDPERRLVALALDMRDAVKRYTAMTGMPIEVRIGVHTGPVVAGVIGRRRFVYDLWGDTVNIAARLETAGAPGRVHVSADVAERLREGFQFEPRGRVALKGRGTLESFFVFGAEEQKPAEPKAG